MRSYEEAEAAARDTPPFSNGTEIHAWMENWCWRPCLNPAEKAWQDYESGKRRTAPTRFPGGCPLILLAMSGKTPAEWLEQDRRRLGDQYHCIEFRGPDDGPAGPPRPKPEPPGMDGLFERPPRRTRMLSQPDNRLVAVGPAE